MRIIFKDYRKILRSIGQGYEGFLAAGHHIPNNDLV